MKRLLLAMTLLTSASLAVWGDAIPYPNVGTVAPTVLLTAAATGDIDGYFYGFSAADTDVIQMCDLTQIFCSPFELPNQTTPVGTMTDFGSVVAGDVIVFNLENESLDYILSSDPALSVDGLNHAYVTSYSGTGGPAGIPAGTFIGMEDLKVPGSDLDYNDDEFVVTNLSTSQIAEPSSLIPCLGLLVLIPVLGRTFAR